MTTITPPPTRIELCGQVTVELDGREVALPGRQPRLLLAYLVRNRTRTVARPELIDVLWPAALPHSPSDTLNTLVARLRKMLGADVITGRSDLALVLSADAWIDVESAFAHARRAEAALERSDWRAASHAAWLTLSIAERGFLPEAEGPWVDEERGRLDELRLAALECVAACGLGLGGAQASVADRAARALILTAPHRETGHLLLMQALAARGRVVEALDAYERFRRLLGKELGAVPGPELRALHERLLGRDRPACVRARARGARPASGPARRARR